MPRNIEIKARIPSIEAIELQVAALADHGPIEMVQDDTFFGCERGRLKLRVFSVDKGELIFYRRRKLRKNRSMSFRRLTRRTRCAGHFPSLMGKQAGYGKGAHCISRAEREFTSIGSRISETSSNWKWLWQTASLRKRVLPRPSDLSPRWASLPRS